MSLGYGVDVILRDTKLSNAPYCSHGPALLFEKFHGPGSKPRQYFACSACRDRKQCNFFLWADEVLSKRSRGIWKKLYKDSCSDSDVGELTKRREEILLLPANQRIFCSTCQMLDKLGNEQHLQHETIQPLTDLMMKRPSTFLKPLNSNSKNAQYLFAEETLSFLVNMLRDLRFRNVLCIGAPSLHECLITAGFNSLLLDLDTRYRRFFPDTCLQYNLFNHHFFSNDSAESQLTSFVSLPDTAIVIDPPFGGLVDVIHHSLSLISNASNPGRNSLLPVFWIFPYFMENRVTSVSDRFVMLDYKVNYSNHGKYKALAKGKGSPVRLFTNVKAKDVVLPSSEGYRLCTVCERYVSKENKHCEACNSCTSKDGSTYRHCDECERCVKPSRVHCFTCKTCELQDHDCRTEKSKGCHICGSLEHKRRTCPQRLSAKRQFTEKFVQQKAKKRRRH